MSYFRNYSPILELCIFKDRWQIRSGKMYWTLMSSAGKPLWYACGACEQRCRLARKGGTAKWKTSIGMISEAYMRKEKGRKLKGFKIEQIRSNKIFFWKFTESCLSRLFWKEHVPFRILSVSFRSWRTPSGPADGTWLRGSSATGAAGRNFERRIEKPRRWKKRWTNEKKNSSFSRKGDENCFLWKILMNMWNWEAQRAASKRMDRG